MTTHDRVRQQLHALETLLREHRHWRQDAPQAHLFTSTQPFFYGYHGTAGMAAMGIDSTYAYPT